MISYWLSIRTTSVMDVLSFIVFIIIFWFVTQNSYVAKLELRFHD
ncbi:hypothetical protein FEDK69T_28760 [Flavobacterium enshiense DK69]|nr:hypothetical protein FEDK69T_28760 [Flavobacterium enshiense DK69]